MLSFDPTLLATLPLEIAVEILKTFTIPEVVQLGSVNKNLQALSRTPALWQYFLNRDFPYAYYYDYEMFDENPSQYYQECFEELKKELDKAYVHHRKINLPDYPSVKNAIQDLFAYLHGDQTAIAHSRGYNIYVENFILRYAASHGNIPAWNKLEETQKKIALQEAHERHYLHKLVMANPNIWQALDESYKRKCVYQCAEFGSLNGTTEFTQDKAITRRATIQAAVIAAGRGELSSLLFLLSGLEKESDHIQTVVLSSASFSGEVDIVKYLLEHFFNDKSIPNGALISATLAGKHNILELFFKIDAKRKYGFKESTLKNAIQLAKCRSHFSAQNLIENHLEKKYPCRLPLSTKLSHEKNSEKENSHQASSNPPVLQKFRLVLSELGKRSPTAGLIKIELAAKKHRPQ